MTLAYLKSYQIHFFTFLFCTASFTSVVYAEKNLTEKVAEHGSTIATDIKNATTDIGAKTVNGAIGTLRRIFNLFFDIPEKTVNRFKTAADRVSRESSFFVHEARDLGDVIKESAQRLANNARALGQRVSQVSANLNKTECSQLAIVFTLPSFIDPAEVNTLKEVITKHNEQEILTEGSSSAALELLHSLLDLVSRTIKQTDDVQLNVVWNIGDGIESNSLIEKHKNATHIAVVFNGALGLNQWDHTVEDVLRIQHYAKKNKSDSLLLDAVENLCKKAIYHSIFKSVQIV